MLLIKTARWMNFLSTGNYWNELRLDTHPTTLIVGLNGGGKSTFLDAVSFALYGKPFRNVTKNQLVNSINQKGAMVEIEFHKEGHEYLVRRGIKPGVFEIYRDGVLIPQDASVKDYQEILERDVLRMDHRSFCQVVTLGSASFVPFMQLPAGHRREFVEDLLDIRVFSSMAKVLKSRMDDNKTELLSKKKDLDNSVSFLEASTSDYNRVLEKNQKARSDNAAEVARLKGELKALKDEYETSLTKEKELREAISDSEDVLSRRDAAIKELAGLEHRERDLSSESHFLESGEVCPTCRQGIDPSHAVDRMRELLPTYEEVTVGIAEMKLIIKECDDRIDSIQSLSNEANSWVQKKYIAMVKAEETSKAISALQKPDPSIDEETILADRMKGQEIKTNLLKEEVSGLVEKRKVMDSASVLLKDGGIKTHIVRQYVPLINRLVNRYLTDMDFFVQFELDEEFNESIKSRFRDVFSYASFSEGEKLRIDLALLFTWRDIAKIRNSASCNLLVMDEILDSSLDSGGIEELIKVLKHVTQGTNTFIISHRGDQLVDKFNEVVRFKKDGYFSRRVE